MLFLNSKQLVRAGIWMILTASVLCAAVQADESVPASVASKVALFSQPFCPGCVAAKQYFGEQDVDFVEFDISASAKARDAFERLGGRGTPFLLIDGKRVHGFFAPVIEQRLLESGLLGENH